MNPVLGHFRLRMAICQGNQNYVFMFMSFVFMFYFSFAFHTVVEFVSIELGHFLLIDDLKKVLFNYLNLNAFLLTVNYLIDNDYSNLTTAVMEAIFLVTLYYRCCL